MREENMGSIMSTLEARVNRGKVLRRRGSQVIMRARRVAGMGEGEDAEAGGAQYAAEQAAATVAGASSSVWSDISKVLSSVLPSVATVGTAAINAKYQTALAAATAKLTGGAVAPAATIRTIAASGPWYKQTWVLVGGGIAALGIGYIVISSLGGKKGRRR
jgi:hypothetical protein